MDTFRDWLIEQGWGEAVAVFVALASAVLASVVLAVVSRRIGKAAYTKLAKPQKRLIDGLSERQVFRVAAWALSIFVAHELVEPVLSVWPRMMSFAGRALDVLLGAVVVLFVSRLLRALVHGLETRGDPERRIPVKALGQGLQVVIWTYGSIFVIAILVDRDVTSLLTGLTALGAVLVYVFRDPILGWTAGLQIAANDLARVGDWISAPAYRADGVVTDIALTTVKVQNWDHTIATIPTYALVSQGFQNWRGMLDANGRRFKRSLHIDASTVRSCDESTQKRLVDEGLIPEPVEGETTNLALFRRWAEDWIREHPEINPELTRMVREHQPEGRGIPVEIYAFTAETAWIEHEHTRGHSRPPSGHARPVRTALVSGAGSRGRAIASGVGLERPDLQPIANPRNVRMFLG